MCAIPQMDVKMGILSASISWWTLKIPRCHLQRVGDLSLAPRPNSKFLPELLLRGQWQTTEYNPRHKTDLAAPTLQQSMVHQNQNSLWFQTFAKSSEAEIHHSGQ